MDCRICFLVLALVVGIQGNQFYNKQSEICCNGNVLNKGETTDCCGSVTYDYTKSVCCNGQLHPNPNQNVSIYECCEDKSTGSVQVYDYTAHQCCDGQLLKLPVAGAVYGCCSGQLYNFTSQFCCKGQVWARYNNKTCCVDQVYDTKNQTCCEQWGRVDGRFVRKDHRLLDHEGNRTTCCAERLYDPDTETCCNNAVKPKPDRVKAGEVAKCCNGDPYGSNYLCCEQWRVVKGKKKLVAHALHRTEYAPAACCGLKLYDYTNEVCCNETIHIVGQAVNNGTELHCCGNHLIKDTEHEFCHKGQVVHRNDTRTWICADTMYNEDTHTCCNGQLIVDGPNNGCCWSAKKGYNNLTEACCPGKVEALSDKDQKAGKTTCCLSL